MTTRNQAINAIRNYSVQVQAELDAKAVEARARNLASLQAALLDGVIPGTAAYDLATYVAQNVTIGRADGYPAVQLPDDVWAVIVAARSAGILPTGHYGNQVRIGAMCVNSDGKGFYTDPPGQTEDYQAWREAKEYRERQTWQTL